MSDFSVNRTATSPIVKVRALPDEVCIEIDKSLDGYLTASEAEELASHIIAAAKEARTLEWVEDEDGGFSVQVKAA